MKYKMYKNNNSSSKSAGLWFARADIDSNPFTTDDISDEIQKNCSMKESDVVAVLKELKGIMKRELQNGRRVVIKDLGSFKLGISTTGVETTKKFDVKKNITNVHVIFAPEKRYDDATGRYITMLTEGITFQETKPYSVDEG